MENDAATIVENARLTLMCDKNGSLLYSGDNVEQVLEVIRKDYVITETVSDTGKAMVEIGYSLHPADGWAEWGKGYTLDDARRYAIGAWLG